MSVVLSKANLFMAIHVHNVPGGIVQDEITQNPIQEDKRNPLVGYLLIVTMVVSVGMFYFGQNDGQNDESSSEMCYNSDCPEFQHPLELPVGLQNPYTPTKGGTSGRVPPALTVSTSDSSIQFGISGFHTDVDREFMLPLSDEDSDVIRTQRANIANVVFMVSHLDGVKKLTLSEEELVVDYVGDTNTYELRDQILTIIGHFG